MSMSLGLKPRQELALIYYKDPASETFGNLLRSAMRAGYTEATARQLTMNKPQWLSENVKRDIEMVQVAEANLLHYANLKKTGIDSKIESERAKIQLDASKFILKTLARKKYKEDDKDEIPSNVQINIINYAKAQGVDIAGFEPIKEVKEVENEENMPDTEKNEAQN